MYPPLVTRFRRGVLNVSLADSSIIAEGPWTNERLTARLIESLPLAQWPASNGYYTEHLEVLSLTTRGTELEVELRRLVDFTGASPAFDEPWSIVIGYVVTLPSTPDAPALWSERFSRVE